MVLLSERCAEGELGLRRAGNKKSEGQVRANAIDANDGNGNTVEPKVATGEEIQWQIRNPQGAISPGSQGDWSG